MNNFTIYPTFIKNKPKTSKTYLTRISKLFSLRSFIKILIPTLIFMFTSQQMFSQTPPIEHQEMRRIGELTGHVDVGFKIVKCENSNANQVFLKLENESERYNNPNDVTTSFEIVILDYESKESFTFSINNISVKTAEVLTANCENTSSLKIDLPASYNPKKVAAYVKPTND